ncbi:MAG: endolytic transglycosylase MltG [Endomicrobium sp.]|nr:endolytic transglycosylase MltG [Endomicrobium sp.]
MAKKIRIFLIILVLSVIFLSIYLLLPDRQITIVVNQGATFFSVANQLKENHLIVSKRLFMKIVRLTNSSNKLKAGIYTFSYKGTMVTILKDLTTGSKNNIKVTVPEGNNIKQTAQIISKTIEIDKEKFIKISTVRNLEGYLMPETYFVVPGVSEEQIIDMMYNEFNKKITPAMLLRAKEMNMDFKDIVILASIIEKEAVKPNEKSIISAVFHNRLKKKIRLQSCATVLYAMGINKEKLTIKDTKFKSPYNTYLHFGLPPGPICSPGVGSINAALYPSDVRSLFFVSKGNGEHLFADDLEEHNRNKQEVSKRQVNI